jgi:thioredoxin-dependent peroxiredoxin
MKNKLVPDVIFKTRVYDETIKAQNKYKWLDVSTKEIFSGKKVVIFSLPGAFTPTCSSNHLPGYENHFDDLRKLGVDEVICISVNDAFVMFNWAKDLDIKKVRMLPDGSALFTKGMDMLVKKDNLGFGERSWRYSAYVVNGVIEKMFIEEGKMDNCPNDPFEVSGVEVMINYLNSK